MTAEYPPRQWTFLSNHAHVLVCLAANPNSRMRDMALSVGITERAVQKIVDDLEEAGALSRARAGRRNVYRLNLDAPLRHPLESHRSIGSLLSAMLERAALKRLPSL
jgi:DNA-binding IclR family transcriptional regulator